MNLIWQPSPAIKASFALHAGAAAGALFYPDFWQAALGLIAANQAVLTTAGLLPRSKLLGPNLTRLPAEAAARQEMCLTFDDGPDPEVTPQVLDLLDAAGVQATFFCIGEKARRHPALTRQIVARGHGVENHSMHHFKHFAALGPRGMCSEIVGAQDCLGDITGRRPAFFRPTAGLRSPFLDPVLSRLGLKLAAWTRRSYDTRRGDPEVVHRALVRNLAAGDILLLHDGNAARTAGGDPVILKVLPRLLADLQAAHLRPLPLHCTHASDRP